VNQHRERGNLELGVKVKVVKNTAEKVDCIIAREQNLSRYTQLFHSKHFLSIDECKFLNHD
jgi:hypothetical protein